MATKVKRLQKLRAPAKTPTPKEALTKEGGELSKNPGPGEEPEERGEKGDEEDSEESEDENFEQEFDGLLNQKGEEEFYYPSFFFFFGQ